MRELIYICFRYDAQTRFFLWTSETPLAGSTLGVATKDARVKSNATREGHALPNYCWRVPRVRGPVIVGMTWSDALWDAKKWCI